MDRKIDLFGCDSPSNWSRGVVIVNGKIAVVDFKARDASFEKGWYWTTDGYRKQCKLEVD